jgi:acyl-CoA thioesterase YciA
LTPFETETLTHRLILPRDANHHGTLYAGNLVALALEAAYSTAFRAIGDSANLVLKRVLDLRCLEPVPIGEVVQIRGCVLRARTAQVIVGLYGTPLKGRTRPWMDAVMQFVQVDEAGRPRPIDETILVVEVDDDRMPWGQLKERAERLLSLR